MHGLYHKNFADSKKKKKNCKVRKCFNPRKFHAVQYASNYPKPCVHDCIHDGGALSMSVKRSVVKVI